MIKENKTKTLTFRLTEGEFSYLEKSAFVMGTTPSKLIRQLIQMSINAAIQNENTKNELLEKKKD